MTKIHIRRISVAAAGRDPARVASLVRRAAELLGWGLAAGDAVQPGRRLVVEVADTPGQTDERLAQLIARRVRRKLS